MCQSAVPPLRRCRKPHTTAGTLPGKGRAPKTGFTRASFGAAWADVDRNGCDTRNNILGRDLTAKTFKAGTRNCLVLPGLLLDPYSARRIAYPKRTAIADAIQVDHVVALGDAWQKGAQQWAPTKRLAFANDPLNLLAVDAALNMQKGAGDTAT